MSHSVILLRKMFGYFAATAHSASFSEVHTLHTILITKTSEAPKGWPMGLSVVLEKIAGVTMVTELCTRLLVEADSNYHNILISRDKMMKLARDNGLVPKEI
jgi:hypothetical protein